MAEISEIKRTGPPTPRHLQGKTATWTVPINAAPPKPWLALFTKTKDRSIDCDPDKVRFYQATMIFDSGEKLVPVWIQFIEKWIASANQRYAAQLALEGAARQEEEVDPAQRLRDLEEKFKNL